MKNLKESLPITLKAKMLLSLKVLQQLLTKKVYGNLIQILFSFQVTKMAGQLFVKLLLVAMTGTLLKKRL